MRREQPPQPRLYRAKWMTFLSDQLGEAENLTAPLVTALWKATLKDFIQLPVEERPLLANGGRPVELANLFTRDGIELLEDLTAAEIIRSDDIFIPGLKIKNKKHKSLQDVLNLTFDHPDLGRQRLGKWTPFDAARYVTPKLSNQSLLLAQRSNEVAKLIASCRSPLLPIIDQLNEEADDEEEKAGFI